MYPTPNWLSHPVCSGSCSLSSMPHQSSLPILLSSQLHYFFPASWTPKKLKTKLFLGFAETGPNKLTVGKIFGGMLILENWKLTKFSAIPLARKHLSVNIKDCILGWPGFRRLTLLDKVAGWLPSHPIAFSLVANVNNILISERRCYHKHWNGGYGTRC